MSGALGIFLVDFQEGSIKRSPAAKNTQWGRDTLFNFPIVQGKLDIHMHKNEIGPLYDTTHKN